MIAAENVMSPLAEAFYFNDGMHRYAEGLPFKRFYQGLPFIDQLEVFVNELLAQLMNCPIADIRPISGTTANASVFKAYGRYGGKACVIPVQAGAHVSHTKFGVLGALGIEQIPMALDEDGTNIDPDRSAAIIRETKPDFVVLGGSVYLFPHPTKEIAEVCKEVGAKLVYDAAHVLGLIMGKRFPNPFPDGADLATSSTHKTFPGPQGGVIFAKDKETYKPVKKTIFPIFVCNHHLHRLAATAVTALEMKYFGESYAEQIVRNAKRLAEALHERGFKVLGEKKGFTQSHQVVLDVRDLGGGAAVAQLLENANIIVNKNLLPWDPPEKVKEPSGIRLGVQELTRWGMRESDMEEVAEFFKMLLIEKKPVEEVRQKVVVFRRQFQRIHFTFDINLDELPAEFRVPFLI